MKLYVINLDSSPERLEWMDAAFKRMKLDYIRVSAVDGRTLSASEKARLCAERSDGLPWIDGEIGVFLSHRKCWEFIVSANEDYGAVFEDDAHFSPNAVDFLRDHAWIPPGMDIVKLETFGQETVVDKVEVAVLGHSLARLRATHWGCCGYVLSKRIASKLLELTSFLVAPVDVVLFDPDNSHCRFPAYQLLPSICIQDFILRQGKSSGFLASTIDEERALSHRQRQRPKPQGLKKLRREMTRPVLQIARFIDAMRVNLLSDRRVLTVPMATTGNGPENDKN